MSQKIDDLPQDQLIEAAIRAALSTRWLGRTVRYERELGSTNVTLAELAAAGAPAGTLLITDYQSQGKGRLNRRWDAPPGSSLLFSLLFRPDWPADRATWLTMIAGLAALTAIEEVSRLSAALKWPNDVMVQTEQGWCKVGGLLLETEVVEDRLVQAIQGVGLNVNIPSEALPAAVTPPTSLLAASGEPVARLPLLAAFLHEMERCYDLADAGHSPQVLWNERLVTRGQPVRVETGAHIVEGVAIETDAWGRLLVRDAAGQVHTVAAGDVTLRDSSS